MKKKTLAIFDFTDCEGCETQFFALKKIEKYQNILDNFEIISWRLADSEIKDKKLDIAIVEGTPTSKEEIELLKILRINANYLIALGSCACIGGIPAMVNEKNRKKLIEYVYGKNYKAKATNAKPLSYYVKIDYMISGCPVNPKEIEETLANIANGRLIKEKQYPVCLECKANNYKCVFTQNKEPCLGSITKAGCGAICIKNGLRCYGCWGPLKEANIPAMIIALKKQGHSKTKIAKILEIFWQDLEDVNKYFPTKQKI